MLPDSRAPIADKLHLRLLPRLFRLKEVRLGLKLYAWATFILSAIIWVHLESLSPHDSFAFVFLLYVLPISGPVPYLLLWNFRSSMASYAVTFEFFLFGLSIFIDCSLVILPLLLLPFVKRRSWLARLGFCVGVLFWLLSGFVSQLFFWGMHM